ncbi:MAG: cyclomaltodextrinase N-terminal domain-containing protein, partial [Muribaculaceae bacterium]|nr:cyclomaltodextrinase N-terminal domain-containing protein [Muribaculaceae bacterium]
MKRLVLMMAVAIGVIAGHAAVKVDRIEPTNWYVGLKDPSVQLMVYGEGIRDAEVAIDYAGVTIDSLVRLDSPNYLLIYLNTRDAQPGTMEMTFKQGRSKKKVKYQLLAREMSGDKRVGFSNADVLYMLMPDRFADGNPANNQIPGMEAYTNDRTKPSLRHGGDICKDEVYRRLVVPGPLLADEDTLDGRIGESSNGCKECNCAEHE